MVKSLCLTRQPATGGTQSSLIYFANDDLIDKMMEWIKSRYQVLDMVSDKLDKNGIMQWMFYYGTNKIPCILFSIPIACKGYIDQSIIYRVNFTNKRDNKSDTSDLYTDKAIAEGIANIINTNSDIIECSINDVMVINSEESLHGLQKFLVSSNDIGDQWDYFASIEP